MRDCTNAAFRAGEGTYGVRTRSRWAVALLGVVAAMVTALVEACRTLPPTATAVSADQTPREASIDVEAYRQRASDCYCEGRYEEALKHLHAALRYRPNDPRLYNDRGKVYAAMGNHERALADFSRAVRLQPAFAEAYSNRGTVYAREGDLTAALADFDRALTIDPEDVIAYYSRGRVLQRSGDHYRAIVDFTMVLARRPDQSSAYRERGLTWAALGEHRLALPDLTKSLECDVTDAEVLKARGDAEMQTDRLDAAIEDYRRCCNLQPRRADAHRVLGEAYFKRWKAWDKIKGWGGDTLRVEAGEADLERAIQSFAKAVQLGVGDADTYRQLAEARVEVGQYIDAVRDYTRAIELDPNNANLCYQRGRLHAKMESFALAEGDYNRALRIDPQHLNALVGRNQLFVRMGRADRIEPITPAELTPAIPLELVESVNVDLERRFRMLDDALAAITGLMDRQPEDAGLFYLRGELRRQRGLDAAAVEDFTRAISIDPESVLAYTGRGQTFLAEGAGPMGEAAYARAIEDFAAAIELDPHQLVARKWLALAHSHRGKHDRAIRTFDEVIQVNPYDLGAYRARADVRWDLFRRPLREAKQLVGKWAALASQGRREEADNVLGRLTVRLQELANRAPELPEAYLELAKVYTVLHRYADVIRVCEDGIRHCGRAEGIREDASVTLLLLRAGEAALEMAARCENSEQADEWRSRARAFVADADARRPGDPLVRRAEGRLLVVEGRLRAALAAFHDVEKYLYAQRLVNWENRKDIARLHIELGEPAAAKAMLGEVAEQARGERASDTAFWLLYGEALRATGDFEGALAVADRLLLSDADNRAAKTLKAAALAGQGELDAARELAPSDRQRTLLEAHQLSLDGDHRQAVEVLRAAHEKTPADPKLTLALVAELMKQARLDEAAEVIERACAADPESTQLKTLAVRVRPDLSDAEREQALLEIIDGEPDQFRRALMRMEYHGRKGEWATALEHLNRAERLLEEQAASAVDAAPEAVHRALLARKMQLGLRLNDEETTQAALAAAERHNVDGAEGNAVKGQYYMLREDWEAAVRALAEAVEQQPFDTRSLTQLGLCLHRIGRTKEAYAAVERAIRIDPACADAYQCRGSLHAAERRFDEAIADFTEVIGLRPQSAKAFRARGQVHAERGDYDLAAADLARALELDPEDAVCHLLRGEVYDRQGITVQALAEFDRAIELQPDLARAYCARGRFFGRQGEVDDALAEFNKAIELDPDYASAYVDRGLAYARKGLPAKARQDWDEAVRLDPIGPAGRKARECLDRLRRRR